MDDEQQTYEDLLVQLYTHDNTIEEQYELGTEDPQYDEDHALEAYESILQTCNRFPPEQENESTLKTVLRTLAARFLAHHFYKFPHVQQHVMDALVAMCGTEHVVAVRMQSLQSLWSILKTAVRGRDALSSLARQRIQACVDLILDGKKEGGGEGEEEDEDDAQKQRTQRLMERVAKQVQVTLDKAAQGIEGGEGERENKSLSPPRRRQMQHHHSSRPSPYAREERMSRSRSQTPSPHRSSRRPERRPSPEPPMRSTRRDERKPTHHHRRSSSPRPPSRSSHHSTHAPPIPVPLNPKHCPPGPHLFIGGVPKDAIPSDFVSFLAPVDPDLTPNSIIIKIPSQSLPAGYAFVNMTSTSNAIDAIHYVKTTPYKTGRPLICDFARGPPTPIVRFIERQNLANPSLHGHDATHLVNFDEKPPYVWKQLIRELDKIGHVDEVDAEERRHGGLVKFEDVECAKALIRRHHLIVEGYEVMPIYYMKGGVTIGAHISYTNDPKPLSRDGGKPQFSHRSSYREDSSSSRKHYPPTSSSHRYEASRYEPERGRHSSRSPSRDGGRPSRSSRDDRSIAEIARTSRFSGTRPNRSSLSPSPTSSRRPSSSGRGGPTSSYDGHRTSHRSTTQSSSSRYKKRSRSFDEEQNHHYSQRSRVEGRGGNGSNGTYKRREKSFEENADELMVDYEEE